jgi:hypothetical protein
MLAYMTVEFGATWESAGSLSVATVNENRMAVISLSIVAGISAISLLLAMRSEVSVEELKSKETGTKKQLMLMSADEMDEFLESALPRVFRAESHVALFLSSMVERHRWLNAMFVKSTSRPRHYRVMALINYVVLVLFGNAITFQLTMPDSNQCDSRFSEADCSSVQSPYSKSPLCEWDMVESECVYIHVINRLSDVVMLTIISAMFTLPLTLLHDFLINNVLCSNSLSESKGSMLASIRKTIYGDRNSEFLKFTAGQRLAELSSNLLQFRSQLGIKAKSAFDDVWGTRANNIPSDVRSLIL